MLHAPIHLCLQTKPVQTETIIKLHAVFALCRIVFKQTKQCQTICESFQLLTLLYL